MLENGRTAEQTIGATKHSSKILPFFSSRSIFSKRLEQSKVIRALSSTTIKSLHTNGL